MVKGGLHLKRMYTRKCLQVGQQAGGTRAACGYRAGITVSHTVGIADVVGQLTLLRRQEGKMKRGCFCPVSEGTDWMHGTSGWFENILVMIRNVS